jgi:hypothetical protein
MNFDTTQFLHYMHMQTGRRAAFAEYNAASHRLELAWINERNAEIASQSFVSVAGGKLHVKLGELTDREREIGIAFARYAIYGRTD